MGVSRQQRTRLGYRAYVQRLCWYIPTANETVCNSLVLVLMEGRRMGKVHSQFLSMENHLQLEALKELSDNYSLDLLFAPVDNR